MPAKKPTARKSSRKNFLSQLPPWMLEVTPVSKALAMTTFVVLPFLAFWVGVRFQTAMLRDLFSTSQVVIRKGCSPPEQWLRDEEENLDGAEQGRVGQTPLPTPTPSSKQSVVY